MKESTDPEAVAVALRAGLAKLNRRLRAQEEPDGLGATALSLLGRLFRDGPATATMLARHERLQPQSLTRALRSMEARGLIVRATNDSDRRQSSIAITAEGIRRLRQSVRTRESWLASAMASTLSATERDFLRLAATLLERLADAEE